MRAPDEQLTYQADAQIADDIEGYLEAHERKTLLRFITCGSVDDGKSTLIGRLFYDSKAILEDQLEALEADSKRVGTQGQNIDFALLLDGLSAEREQGITIDVAYRFFSTSTRKFIVADSPGHEQYTRNMVTAASTADVAVILVDARKGLLTQTRRHSFLVSLLGIRQVALAINKMDLVDYSEAAFTDIENAYREFAAKIGITQVTAIPISALRGDNLVARGGEAGWYVGPTLMQYLDSVPIAEDLSTKSFRMPVQWVNRPNQNFRGFAGLISSGIVRQGDTIQALPSGRASRVASIVTAAGNLPQAVAGQSVTLTLSDEIDVSRGDVIVSAESPPDVADRFECTLVWVHDEAMLPGRCYLMKIGTRTVTATVTRLKHRIDVNTLEHMAAQKLELNDIGVCEIEVDRPIVFTAYSESRSLGGFILIDRMSNATIGAGMLHFALRRASNLSWQALDVNKQARSQLKSQKACVLWLTGLSGAGKSTIANLVEKKLLAMGRHTYLLDGDNVRHGLNKDLGFTAEARVENVRRVAEVSRLMVDAGLIVLVSFISPYRAERRAARALLEPGEFFEVFIDTPLAVAEKRDVKGLYTKARSGQIANFTGIDSAYEIPEAPEARIDTTKMSPEQAAELIVSLVPGATS
jgi:bifunctional enzyme CysN/CysC